MSLTISSLVPQRPFISVAKPQKFGNETYDAHVLASRKTNDSLKLTFDLFTTRSNLYGENVEMFLSQNVLMTNG